MMGRAVRKALWRRYLRRNTACTEEVEEFSKLSPDCQRKELSKRLKAQIQYFGTRGDALPEWREAAKIAKSEDLWKVWSSLPILDKKALCTQFPATEMQIRFNLQGVVSSTGGSTGEPTKYFHDIPMLKAKEALNIYARRLMGWYPGMATVIVWGSERDIGKWTPPRARLHNRLLRLFLVDGYNLTAQTVERVLALVKRYRPVAIYGFSSMLEFVAQKTLELNRTPCQGGVRTAWNGGEMLLDHQREAFRRAFGVPILNCYGGRELGVMACQRQETGPLHVFRPWQFLEVIDDHGKPVGPGESGRLVWTNMVCRGTPFLRYDVGDLGAFRPDQINESGVVSLQELHGRTAGLLRLPNGRQINCIFWNHLFKDLAEVRQFQVVLRHTGALDLLLTGRGFSPHQESHLRGTIGNLIGDLPLRISWVERIPRTREGKLVQVIRENEYCG